MMLKVFMIPSPDNKYVIFQVLEQRKEIRDFLSEGSYAASNGIIISSNFLPELKTDSRKRIITSVFLQGNDIEQHNVVRAAQVDDAKKEIDRISTALLELVIEKIPNYMKPVEHGIYEFN